MVTLQGVIILRISDFRRFFNWREFWLKKDEFMSLFKKEIDRRHVPNTEKKLEYYFVDNEKEFHLLEKLYQWLKEPDKELECRLELNINQSGLRIGTSHGLGDSFTYSLGRLKEKIENTKEITKKTIIGYTLMYLLLKADEKNSDIDIDYNNYSLKNNAAILEYNYCYNDIILEQTAEITGPLRRCIFVNSDLNNKIRIKLGEQTTYLEPGSCIIGVFCENRCYRLLPNILSGANNRITLKLKSNQNTAIKTTYLEIHKPGGIETINDIVSIGFDTNEQPICLHSNGKMQIVGNNFLWQNQYNNIVNNLQNGAKIIAAEVVNGYLNIFTDNEVLLII